MSIRVLSAGDVHRLLPVDVCAPAMREALIALACGQVDQPDVRPVLAPRGAPGLLGLMPAHLADGEGVFGLKAVCLFPGNTARGLDAHQGAVLLFDGATGEARALLNASAITEVRTVAVTAVATDLLSRPDARVLAVLGTGVQGQAHIRGLARVRPFERIRVAARDQDRTRQVCARLTASLNLPVEACRSAEEAVTGADVVVTATNAVRPVLRREWLSPGCHVNAVGSAVAGSQEIDAAAFAAAAVFADSVAAVRAEGGDYLHAVRQGLVGPDHLLGSLGEVAAGKLPGRTGPEQLTLFESVGLAVEDLAAARLALALARDRGIGSVVPY